MRHRALLSFATSVMGDSQKVYRTGELVPPDVGRMFPHLVEEIDATPVPAVEKATKEPGEVRPGFVCDVCGRVAKTAAGLGAHRKVHE